MQTLVAWGLTTLVGAFVGSFLAAYFKKKGENLATHEDIGKLVDQVRVDTTTTKEIEAKISGDMWNQQKRWELKRDALYEAAKTMSVVDDTLSRLHAVYQMETTQTSQWIEEKKAGAYSRVRERGERSRTGYSDNRPSL